MTTPLPQPYTQDAAEGQAAPTVLNEHTFVLPKVRSALLSLMDGSVGTLTPIFAITGLTGKPTTAFFIGLAASVVSGRGAPSPAAAS